MEDLSLPLRSAMSADAIELLVSLTQVSQFNQKTFVINHGQMSIVRGCTVKLKELLKKQNKRQTNRRNGQTDRWKGHIMME